MIAYRLVATIAAAATRWTTNITDLSLAMVGGRAILTVATQPGGGLSSFELTDPGSPLQSVDHLAYPAGTAYLATPRLSVLELGGTTGLYKLGLAGLQEMGSQLDKNGGLGGYKKYLEPGALGDNLTELGQIRIGKGDFIFAANRGQAAVTVHQVTDKGGLRKVSTAQVDDGALPAGVTLPAGASLDRIIAVELGDSRVLVSISGLGNFVATHLLDQNGKITGGTVYSGALGTGFQTPSAIEAVQFGGATYLVMAAQASSSLTVFQLGGDGSITPRDHILDELTTRFQSVTALAAVVVSDRAFVFAGGRDDGISVFTIQPDGRLLHLTTIADTDDMTLARISAIEAVVMDGKIALFVASATEAGITQLVFDPGPIGFTGKAAPGSPTGTAGGDMMLAGPGTIWMGGGAGDDILIAAGESVALLGGPGADIFVPSNLKGRVAIRDFEVGIDRLDLSQLGMVRSPEQLRFVPQSYGVKIFFGEAVIDVFSKDGRTLGPEDFGDDLFAITHYNPPPLPPDKVEAPPKTETGQHLFADDSGQKLAGGAAGDHIMGGAGDDTLLGHGGDDTIFGGGGNDVLYGHEGDDYLDGGAGDDELHGGPGDDTLYGRNGSDTLYGNGGNDYLHGGNGPDFLYGGAGRDTLLGGAGHDYLDGGAGHDELYGGPGRDTLHGGAGHDLLDGGAGHDELYGGPGRDTLIGGMGQDTMTGGAGADVFVWNALAESRPALPDLITDFQPGIDRMDLTALSLSYIGTNSFSRAGQLRWEHVGQQTHIMIDNNGDGRADMLVHLIGRLQLTEDDFLL